MNNSNLIKTIIGTIIILSSFLLIPESGLPGYNIVGYSSSIGLLMLLGAFMLKNTSDSYGGIGINSDIRLKELLMKSAVLTTILLPLGILLFTNIRYKKQIDKNASNLPNYSALKIMTTLILIAQMYLLYSYMFSEDSSTNKLLGLILLSVLNSGLSMLLWSRLAFFMTDGFTISKGV